MQSVIYRSLNHDIKIAFLLRHELRQACRCRCECNLLKNLSTFWKTREENREANENILAL